MKDGIPMLLLRAMVAFIVVGAFVFVGLLALQTLQANPLNRPVFERADIGVKRLDGQTIPLHVELAATPKQKSYGLMFLRHLPQNHGMLFLWNEDAVVDMWMKNTYIPLDMGFIDKDGVIVKIITHAVPFSLQQLSSGQPVRAVLELNDGAFASYGIKEGDRILYPAFGRK